MTRINVVPVEELSDQWLIAEYRELPRCLKQHISIESAPDNYVLGNGHMKWARKHGLFLNKRMNNIIHEMRYRGFSVNFNSGLKDYLESYMLDYYPCDSDISVNRKRLVSKYNEKPMFYRWTKRSKPKYLCKE